MFDQHIIEQVITLWNEGAPLNGSDHPLDLEDVRTIMETVFLSGLKREEDRPVQISVSLAEPKIFANHDARATETELLVFERRLPFTEDALVKLAPAFDPMTTSVLVMSADGEPGELAIWGAMFSTHRGKNRFDPQLFRAQPPDVLTIASKKSGSLSIFRGDNVIARFNAGRFTMPTPTPFTSSLLGWSLLRRIKSHQEFKHYGAKYWHTYRDVIDRLLVESNKRGHGGTVVWIPEQDLEIARQYIVPKYVLKKGPDGVEEVERLCSLYLRRKAIGIKKAAGEPHEDAWTIEHDILRAKRRIVEHVEFIAQLTRVDGALILSDRLRPLSFGSVLMAPSWRGHTYFGPAEDPTEAEEVELSRYGTRHNSAVNFIAKSPASVAFVLSQDGPIAGLTRKDGENIHWWPDCLSKLWAA